MSRGSAAVGPGEQPARTKAFNKCIAITTSTCLGTARSNIISGAALAVAPSRQSRRVGLKARWPSWPTTQLPSRLLSFPELLIARCHCRCRCSCSCSFSICFKPSHSPQIFKCCSCDFSWSQRNGMESPGLVRVSNDCGLRRRRR